MKGFHLRHRKVFEYSLILLPLLLPFWLPCSSVDDMPNHYPLKGYQHVVVKYDGLVPIVGSVFKLSKSPYLALIMTFCR